MQHQEDEIGAAERRLAEERRQVLARREPRELGGVWRLGGDRVDEQLALAVLVERAVDGVGDGHLVPAVAQRGDHLRRPGERHIALRSRAAGENDDAAHG